MIKVSLYTLLLFIFGLASISNGQEYDLQYGLKKNSKFTVTGSSSSEAVRDQMGNEIVFTLKNNSVQNLRVLSSDENGNISLELEFTETNDEVDSPNGIESTDYYELNGMKVNFILSAKGELTNFKGLEILPIIMTARRSELNESIYKILIERLFLPLPKKPVKIGETWTASIEMNLPISGSEIKLTDVTKYKLVEETIKDGMECLIIEAVTISNQSGEIEQENGTVLNLKRETKKTETIYFAHKKGMILHRLAESKSDEMITIESQGIEMPGIITEKSEMIFQFK